MTKRFINFALTMLAAGSLGPIRFGWRVAIAWNHFHYVQPWHYPLQPHQTPTKPSELQAINPPFTFISYFMHRGSAQVI